jgi:hypothetical protein
VVLIKPALRQKVKVKLDGTGEPIFRTYDVDEIAEVPGAARSRERNLPPFWS